jgi:cyclic 2,3-diphosphoglycerate synthetase
MRVIALVDGEHYPPVTRWGVRTAAERGLEVVAAILVGGSEKLSADRALDLGPDIPVMSARANLMATLAEAIDRYQPQGTLDLSDDPALSNQRRMEAISVSLALGVTYLGSGFKFEPPITEPPVAAPTLAVIGMGKRVAKTAVSGHAARLAAADGLHPVIVAMGRGGPPEPVVAGPRDVTLDALLGRVDRGEHASSDYLEDALTAGVPTIGARRIGGGLAGQPFATNLPEAAAMAVQMGGDPVILEGSGSAIPPVPWDAGVLVAPASLPPEHLTGYLGPFRVLLSDLVVFMIGTGPNAGANNLSVLESHTRRLRADIRVVAAELQPVVLGDVRGKDAFFATTAQEELADSIARELERTAGCRVVSVSSNLADRAGLERDLASAPPFDVLVTELKAAAIDVAARRALERGAEVMFVDNRPRAAGGDGHVDDLLREVTALARSRAGERRAPSDKGAM